MRANKIFNITNHFFSFNYLYTKNVDFLDLEIQENSQYFLIITNSYLIIFMIIDAFYSVGSMYREK